MADINYGGYFQLIPPHMRDSVRAYVENGTPTGKFLQKVIENDYAHAAEHADAINLLCLLDYIKFFLYAAPAACWGSPEAYKNWVETKAGERRG